MNKKAFTLVELIVVITILAILGTIAFLSFQGYSSNARDSVRIGDLNNISRGMEFMLTKTGRVPVPDDSVEITASGTIVSYQGYAGENVLGIIGVNNGGKDPKDDTFYTYSSNVFYNKYQILGFLEDGGEISLNYINNANADLSTRFPITEGSPLGIILDKVTQEPIQQTSTGIDVMTASNNYASIYKNTQDGKLEFTAQNRQTFANRTSSCKSLYESGERGDGVYSVNPKGEYFDVYCDMTTNGGGWTLFYANNGNSDSLIKKGYIQMRDEALNDEIVYDLSDYNYENLAGILDYAMFTNIGHKEIMATNRDFLHTTGQYLYVNFSNSDTLSRSIGNDVLGTSYVSLGHCLDIPNGGSFDIRASNGEEALNNFQIYNGWGGYFGVSEENSPCNNYVSDKFKYGLFYNVFYAGDEFRTRYGPYIGGAWRIDNQYRYFIR